MPQRLFKASHLERISASLGHEIVLMSENSAGGVLMLWDMVAHRFYETPLTEAASSVSAGLLRKDFLKLPPLPTSDRFDSLVASASFRHLVAKFFDYLWSRVPLVLALNPAVLKNKKRRPSPEETEAIAKEAYIEWAQKYPELRGIYSFSGDYTRALKLSRWFVPSQLRRKFIYTDDWLWQALEKHFPELCENENVNQVVSNVIYHNFPMFYNRMNFRYVESVIFARGFGWLDGTLDNDELIAKLQSQKSG